MLHCDIDMLPCDIDTLAQINSKQISFKVLREPKSEPVLSFFCISLCDVMRDLFPFSPCSNLAGKHRDIDRLYCDIDMLYCDIDTLRRTQTIIMDVHSYGGTAAETVDHARHKLRQL